MANEATTDDILRQSDLAAAEYNAPIGKLGAIEEPSKEQEKRLKEFRDKRAEIRREARKKILGSAELDEALKRLKAATKNLNDTAKQMPNATAILKKANKFLGHGTDAVNAIKSVQKQIG